jgi:hypothetical protein
VPGHNLGRHSAAEQPARNARFWMLNAVNDAEPDRDHKGGFGVPGIRLPRGGRLRI